MKKLLTLLLITIVAINIYATDYKQASPVATGMPGDNLNLYIVLNLFKEANSMEDFERMLNSPNYQANNLDLNNDGYIDYLTVTDYGTGNYHTIVIQDIINGYERQDVAIIDLQKEYGNVVHVQIIGDESLYGKNYIIEPYIYQQTATTTQYVNVITWPCISVIFKPGYVTWHSPWTWSYHPAWWTNRTIVTYNVYYNNFNNFGWNNYCQRNNYFNQTYYNNYYSNRRVVSNTVNANINNNVYVHNKNTSVKSNNGNHYGNNKSNWNNGNKPYKEQGNKENWDKQHQQNQQYPKGNNGNWNKGNQPKSTSKNNGQGTSNNNSNWNKPNSNNGQTQNPYNNNGNSGQNNNWNKGNQSKSTNTNNGQGSSNNNGNWNKQNKSQNNNGNKQTINTSKTYKGGK